MIKRASKYMNVAIKQIVVKLARHTAARFIDLMSDSMGVIDFQFRQGEPH